MPIRGLILLLVLLCGLDAATYHLDQASTAEQPDGSQAMPWKTLAQMQATLAASPGAGGGAVVRIAPGDYGDYIEGVAPNDESALAFQRLTPRREDWLRLEAADPARPPMFRYLQIYGNRSAKLHLHGIVFLSKPPHLHPAVVVLRHCAGVRFTACRISAEDDGTGLPEGVSGVQQVEDLAFENCEIHHVEAGLSIGAKKLLVRNCEFHDLSSSALKIGNEASQTILEGNYIHHQIPRIIRLFLYGAIVGQFKKGDVVVQEGTGAKGSVYTVLKDRIEVTPTNKLRILFALGKPVRLQAGGEGMGPLTKVEPSDLTHGSGLSLRCSDLIARGNVIHNFGSTAAIFLYPDKADATHVYHDILIENNLVFDALTRHIALGDLGRNIVIRNNTVPTGDIQLYTQKGQDLSGVQVINNICTGIVSMSASDLPTLKAANNLAHTVISRTPRQIHNAFAGYPDSIFLPDDDAGHQAFAGLFLDFAKRDFRLREGSRAIGGARKEAVPATDLTGGSRDAQPDIGCFELNAKGIRLVPPLGPTAKISRTEAYQTPDPDNP